MASCANCGELLQHAYCPRCGQAAHEGHAPTIAHFFHELIHEISHVDGKIGRTVRALLTRPGLLTAEYWSGRVVSWIRPIRLFLIVAAAHLFSAGGIGPLNFHVFISKNAAGETYVSVSGGNASMVRRPPGYRPVGETESKKAEAGFEKVYLSVRYLSPVLFALACWAVYRKRQRYLVNQLVFSLHFYSFWYALAVGVGLLLRWNGRAGALGLLCVPYLYLALRRVYKQRWFVTLFKTVALSVGLFGIEFGLYFLAFGLWRKVIPG